MITRKDLANYSREEIHNMLRDMVYFGKTAAQGMLLRNKLDNYTDRQKELCSLLCSETSDRLMLIIRGYARDGKK